MKTFGTILLKRKKSITDEKGVRKILLCDTREIKHNGGVIRLHGVC
jgi:hypothetical protein